MGEEVTVTVEGSETDPPNDSPEVVVVTPETTGGDVTATLTDLASRVGALEARLEQTNEEVEEAQATAEVAEIVAEGASHTAVEAIIVAEETTEQAAETTETETKADDAPIEDTAPQKTHWFDRKWSFGRRSD